MKTVMPVQVRGPLAGGVLEQLAAWLEGEGYARTVVPQVLGVARGLSAWMDDHDVVLRELTVDVLDAFRASYGVGVPGHTIVSVRCSVLRRFFVETGAVPGGRRAGARTRRPAGQPAPPLGPAAVNDA